MTLRARSYAGRIYFEEDGMMVSDYAIRVGQAIVRLRESRGISADDLAQRIAVPLQLVEAWEAGTVEPDHDTITQIEGDLYENMGQIEWEARNVR